MSEVLVVANRTLGGGALLNAVRARAAAGNVSFRLVVPASTPSAGFVIYDEAVRESAQVRVDLALSVVAGEGITATGEVGDADPFLATMDAIAERRPDEIIVSTHPAVSSGWLRRDLIERIENASGLPVEHVVVDLEQHGLPFRATLVVAARTLAGEELLEHLKAKAGQGERHVFIVVVPQRDGSGIAPSEARKRLAAMLERLRQPGLIAAGMIGDPDPYTATMNAVQYFHISEIVISTLPEDTSKWVADKLVERVRDATSLPVEHIESRASVEA